MTNSHVALGIAQIVFYAPIVPAAMFLMYRNGRIRPRMAWWPMIPFSLMRLAGGPIIIALEHNRSSVGLYIAAIILLNVGVVPLVVATLGFMRAVLMDNYAHNPNANKIGALIRLAIMAAVGLLAAGGGVSSIGTKSSMNLSRGLTLGGYIVFGVETLVLIGMAFYFYRKRWTLLPSSQTIVKAPLLASPFLILRAIFGLLEVAYENRADSKFNPITGNTIAFALMALLPEYLTILIYLYTGYTIAPDRGLSEARVEGESAAEVAASANKSNV